MNTHTHTAHTHAEQSEAHDDAHVSCMRPEKCATGKLNLPM